MKIRMSAPQKVYIPLGRLPLSIYISLGTKYNNNKGNNNKSTKKKKNPQNKQETYPFRFSKTIHQEKEKTEICYFIILFSYF